MFLDYLVAGLLDYSNGYLSQFMMTHQVTHIYVVKAVTIDIEEIMCNKPYLHCYKWNPTAHYRLDNDWNGCTWGSVYTKFGFGAHIFAR